MENVPAGITDVSKLRTLGQGPLFLCVLKLPEFQVGGTATEQREVFAIPFFSRKDGVLLALPLNALPESMIVANQPLTEDSMIGPCAMVNVNLVMEEESGNERPLELETACLLVDFHKSVFPRI